MRPLPARPSAPVALAVALAALAALGGCTRQPTAGLPPGTTVDDLPDSESWDASLRTSADGRPTLAIDASYLARYTRDSAYVYLGPAPDAETAEPVRVRVFDAEGRPRATVTAGEAWVYDDGARLLAQGDVRTVVAGDDGATLQADRMTLEDGAVAAEGEVRASVRASVRAGDGAQVEAARLRYEPDGSFAASGGTVVHLTGSTQATVLARRVSGTAGGGRLEATGDARVQASGGRTLQAGRVVWSRAAGRFRAPGAFSFVGPGERVRGRGLSATADLSRYSFRDITGEIEVRE